MSSSHPAYRAHRCSFHPDRDNPYLRLGNVTVFVRDQDRSLRFYVDQLGFDVAMDASLPSGERWLAVSPPDGTALITLVVPKPGSDDYHLIGQASRIVFLTDDVSRKFEEWCARGVHFHDPPQRQPSGETSASFEDPDGNAFTLSCSDEVKQEVEAQKHAHAERLEAERRVRLELENARQVQAKLFPQLQPPTTTLEYTGLCIQARQVGGDYYDFLNLGRERLGLVIGDVAGKGTAAALLMANLQAHLRNQCATYWSRPFTPFALEQPQRVLLSVNRLFRENAPGAGYTTLFFAEYNDRTQQLRYANCGHPPALVLRRDNKKVERLESTSTVIGLFQQWDCVVGECHLSPGDTLAVYTDGLTESFNSKGEEFGVDRVIDTLRRCGELPPRVLLGCLVDNARKFSHEEQQDDITLVVARCRGH